MSYDAGEPIKRKLTTTAFKNKLHYGPLQAFPALKLRLKVQFTHIFDKNLEKIMIFRGKIRKIAPKSVENIV